MLARRMASRRPRPSARSWLVWSICRMAFFLMTANSTRMPSAEKMFSDCPSKMSERIAKGRVSGSARRMVMGCSQDSNCAARVRYMKTMASRKASMNERPALAISLVRPIGAAR